MHHAWHSNRRRPILLFLLALTVVTANRTCRYGDSPGRWVTTTSKTGSSQQRWRTFSKKCALQDYVYRPALLRERPPATMLLIGDSTDQYIIEDFCAYARATVPEMLMHGGGLQGYDHRGHDLYGGHPDFACNECNACLVGVSDGSVPRQPFLTLTSSKTWGVSPGPPLFGHKSEGWKLRIDKAIQAYQSFTGCDAQLISYGSGLWDLGRWSIHFPSVLESEDQNFENAALAEWMYNLSSVLAYIKAQSPATDVFIYKTLVHNRLSNSNTHKNTTHFGRRSHTVQLNAAGRFVAQAEGWSVLDAEALTAKFEMTEEFTRDDTHQASFISMEIMNIYMNHIYEKR